MKGETIRIMSGTLTIVTLWLSVLYFIGCSIPTTIQTHPSYEKRIEKAKEKIREIESKHGETESNEISK